MKLLIFILAFTTISGTASAETKLDTIYHVYLDDTYIGSVSNHEVADKAVAEVIKDKQKDHEGYELVPGNQITYITEEVFRSTAEDEEVAKQLRDQLTIKAKAVALKAEDKIIAYFKDKEEAEQAITNYKLKFVSEKELNEVEAMKDKNIALSPLKSGESQIIDVSISEEMSFSTEPVDLDQILSSAEATELFQKGTLEERTHQVKQGDVLGTIADDYQLTREQLMDLNDGLTEQSILRIGEELNVLVTKPLLHVIVEKEAYQESASDFKKEYIENSSMPKGETKVTRTGKQGKIAYTYKITEKNGSQTNKETINEKVLETPVSEVIEKGTKVIPSRGTGSFAWPASGGYVSSKMGQRWGKLHKGIDIARPSNYTIKAADHGIVVSAGWDNGGYGNKIVIDHQNGLKTIYAHLKSVSVSPGQKVEKGSAIGIMGSTGDSTGIHLHFEVYKNGTLKNPLDYL